MYDVVAVGRIITNSEMFIRSKPLIQNVKRRGDGFYQSSTDRFLNGGIQRVTVIQQRQTNIVLDTFLNGIVP